MDQTTNDRWERRAFLRWTGAGAAAAWLGALDATAGEPKTGAPKGNRKKKAGEKGGRPASAPASKSPGEAELGIRGTQFTLDGKPKFLAGISYYAATGAPVEMIRKDLDDFAAAGLRWIRVWAMWDAFGDVSAIGKDGKAREPFLDRLKTILTETRRRGMVVDVTINRSALADFAAHQRAAETLARELKPWRNAYFDLGNERDIHDARFVSFQELSKLRRAVKSIDPQRLLTASGGDLSKDDMRRYLEAGQVDFLAPHRPRNHESALRSRQATEEALGLMRELGRAVPIHYQEPFRRGFSRNWEPTADDFMADLEGSIQGGAAGWCLHNGSVRNKEGDGRPRRSFDLVPAEGRLMDQLDEVEREVFSRIATLETGKKTGARPK